MLRASYKNSLLIFFVLFIALLLFVLPKTSHAAINDQMNFQGSLTNPDGTNVTNGNYSIDFSIYTVSSGGTAVWTEPQTVPVTDGIFYVQLGSVNTLTGVVDFNNSSLYLGIKVGADAEMTPRVRLTASPYAFNSAALNGLASGNYVQLAQGMQTDASTTNSSIAINKTGTTAKILQLQRGGVDVVDVNNDGSVLFKNQANSTTAFQIQNSAGTTNLLTVNTTGNAVTVGSGVTTTLGGLLTATAGETISGGTVSLNNNSNNATNINTGTSTGTVTIGGGTAPLAINSTNFDVSVAGVLSGITGFSQASGNFIQSGAGSFGTGTGGVSLNGATSVTGSNTFSVGSGTTTLGGVLNANAGANLAGGVANINVNLNNNTNINTGPSAGTVAIGGGSTLFQINSTNFDLTSAGAVSGITGYTQASGNFLQNGTGTFSTGTGTVSLNGVTSITGSNTLTVGTGTTTLGGLLTANAGLTAVGTINLNNNANNNTNINTGTSTGTTTIGGGNSLFALDSTNFDVSTAGAVSGITGYTQASGNFIQNGAGTFGTATGAVSLNGDTSVAANKSFTANGLALFKDATNSPTAFEIQDSAASQLFVVDTSSSRVYVGDPTADTTGIVVVLDNKTTTGDPTGIDGAMYYNSDMDDFRCYINGEWNSCIVPSLRDNWFFWEEFMPKTIAAGTNADLGNIGEQNWTFASIGAGSTIAKLDVGAVASTQGRIGILNFITNNLAGRGNSLSLDQTSIAGVPSNTTVEWDWAPSNAAAATQTQVTTRIGLHDSVTAAAPTEGIYFQYNVTTTAGNWFRCTTNNSTSTCTDTGIAATTTLNTFQRFKIVTNSAGTQVDFYINEVSAGSNTTNLPGATRSYGPAICINTVNATTRSYMIDYFQLRRSGVNR